MGWRRKRYEMKKLGDCFRLREGFRGDGLDFEWKGFVFRPHFFKSYIRSVNDPWSLNRTPVEIAEIAVHSMVEAEIPRRIPLHANYNLLVAFHDHGDRGEEKLFSLNYVPIKRDIYRPGSGIICALTVMEAEEKMYHVEERRGLPVRRRATL